MRSIKKGLIAIMVSLLVGVFSLCQQPQPAHASSYYTQADSVAAIHWAASRWQVSYYWLLNVAECESGLEPWAYNPSGASGLFQFMTATYYAWSWRIGEYRPLWNPYAAANVAAYLFSRGYSYLWACA